MFVKHKLSVAALALLIAVAAASGAASAADIYRWVDENGRTHIADTVPPRYKGVATKVDTSASKVSEERRAAAIQRAEEIRKAAAQMPATSSNAPQNAASRPESFTLEPGEGPTSGKSADDPECARLRREYAESQACFVRYATQTGIKGEAYDHCKSVPDPSPRCGLTTSN